MTNEDLELLAMGDGKRDAIPTILGFMYQDVLAAKYLLGSQESDNVYIEEVEDILISNDKEIHIYQVKYYPESAVTMKDVYENLLYQFLKINLHIRHGDLNNKTIITYCAYHSNTKSIKNYKVKSVITNPTDIKDEDIGKLIKVIQGEGCKKKNFQGRKDYLFKNYSPEEITDGFIFKREVKGTIVEEIKETKELLYKRFKNNIKKHYNIDLKEVLYPLCMEYIQSSYYDSERSRRMKLSELDASIKEKIENEEGKKEIIIATVKSYIDELLLDVSKKEISHEDNTFYINLQKSTKEFFDNKLQNKGSRFKFINTISNERQITDQDYKEDEIRIYYEHKDCIKIFIKRIWKVLYNLNCNDFKYVTEEVDYFSFNPKGERYTPILVSNPNSNQVLDDGSNIFMRMCKAKNKPKKWYFINPNNPDSLPCNKGVYRYSQSISEIEDAYLNLNSQRIDKPHIIEENIFVLECMSCLNIDRGSMAKKDDDLNYSIFSNKCKKE